MCVCVRASVGGNEGLYHKQVFKSQEFNTLGAVWTQFQSPGEVQTSKPWTHWKELTEPHHGPYQLEKLQTKQKQSNTKWMCLVLTIL